MGRWQLVVLLTLVAAVWALAGFGPLLFFKDLDRSGPFGDTFGAVNSLFSGLAFAGLIYTINLQLQEFKKQRQQEKEEKAAADRQVQEQYLTARLNATSALIQAYSARYSTLDDPRKDFLGVDIPHQLGKQEARAGVLMCEAELGFSHLHKPYEKLLFSVSYYVSKLLSDLNYYLLLHYGTFHDLTMPEPRGIHHAMLEDVLAHYGKRLSIVEAEFGALILSTNFLGPQVERVKALLDELRRALKENPAVFGESAEYAEKGAKLVGEDLALLNLLISKPIRVTVNKPIWDVAGDVPEPAGGPPRSEPPPGPEA